MSERWAIFIDIEGFSSLWTEEDKVLRSLGELMLGIFRIARECYPQPPDRLFAHQFGDAFLVVSDFHEPSLERCATIAVALLRHVAGTGRLARATIAEGDLADIQGCYPREVTNCLEADLTVSLDMGLMTINPIMGTALIRAVALDKTGPKGPLLLMDSSKVERLTSSFPFQRVSDSNVISIDWVHMESDLLSHLQRQAKLLAPTPNQLEMGLAIYCNDHKVKEDWRSNVQTHLNIPIGRKGTTSE